MQELPLLTLLAQTAHLTSMLAGLEALIAGC